MTDLEIRLSRPDRTYRAGETVSGVVVLKSSAPVSHSGLTLRASGVVRPQLDPRTVGIFEAFYSSIKPIDILSTVIEMAPSGKLPAGVPLPFEFPVEAIAGRKLTETYHGVYVSVKYAVEAELVRGGFSKSLKAEVDFIVEVPDAEKRPAAAAEFEITPEALENVRKTKVSEIPSFLIKGTLNRTNCPLSSPFTGEITVVHSAAKIRSIELQLVRVETIAYADGTAREATEIQNLQVGDGDVCRGLAIPLYMIFPRIFTCPTSISDSFKVEFEVNVIVVFEDHYMVTENFPITLYRA